MTWDLVDDLRRAAPGVWTDAEWQAKRAEFEE